MKKVSRSHLTEIIKCRQKFVKALLFTACLFCAAGNSYGQTYMEPIGGKPPAGSKCSESDLSFRVKYQRAFEAVLWSLPAVANYRFRMGGFSHIGYNDNAIVAYSAPVSPKFESLTADPTEPFIGVCTNLKRGPVILEVPAAASDLSMSGQVIDAWQLTIAEIGPSGLDKGRASRYLITGPDFNGPIPRGYIHVSSPNYRIRLIFQVMSGNGKTQKDAYDYAKRLRIYYLSEAKNPPRQVFLDPSKEEFSTLLFYDERYFNDVYDVFTYEPVREQDKYMLGLLATLGIERGKPFNPDPVTKLLMRQAVIDAWHYMQSLLENVDRDQYFWNDRHYLPLMRTDNNQTFTFEYPYRIDIDSRAMQYFWCTNLPKNLAKKTSMWHLCAMKDNTGRPFEAGKTYKVVVPAKMPVTESWSLTIYDRATYGFIYSESNRTTISSNDLNKMKRNADGSVTLFIGPKAIPGYESNWLPTGNKRPMPTFCFYGGTSELFDRTFKLQDFERMDSTLFATRAGMQASQ